MCVCKTETECEKRAFFHNNKHLFAIRTSLAGQHSSKYFAEYDDDNSIDNYVRSAHTTHAQFHRNFALGTFKPRYFLYLMLLWLLFNFISFHLQLLLLPLLFLCCGYWVVVWLGFGAQANCWLFCCRSHTLHNTKINLINYPQKYSVSVAVRFQSKNEKEKKT